MTKLKTIGLAASDNKSAEDFDSLLGDFMSISYSTPADYVSKYCSAYLKKYNQTPTGTIFEYILATLFIREELMPLYYSVKVAFVPNVTYDLMLYRYDNVPICISAKTSLRERYKQSDLEAIALKYVHRKAKCYLLTLEKNEGLSVQKKILSGSVIGLDEVVIVTEPRINSLIQELKLSKYKISSQVNVLESKHIVNREKVYNI